VAVVKLVDLMAEHGGTLPIVLKQLKALWGIEGIVGSEFHPSRNSKRGS
jgi:hypothetical protein